MDVGRTLGTDDGAEPEDGDAAGVVDGFGVIGSVSGPCTAISSDAVDSRVALPRVVRDRSVASAISDSSAVCGACRRCADPAERSEDVPLGVRVGLASVRTHGRPLVVSEGGADPCLRLALLARSSGSSSASRVRSRLGVI